MSDTAQEVARRHAFCYLGLLRCPERFQQIIAILPEATQQRIAGPVERAKSLTDEELINRLRLLRQRVHPRMRPGQAPWESLSPVLKRFLAAFAQENDGRENHQS